jgi:hypothetical protein
MFDHQVLVRGYDHEERDFQTSMSMSIHHFRPCHNRLVLIDPMFGYRLGSTRTALFQYCWL